MNLLCVKDRRIFKFGTFLLSGYMAGRVIMAMVAKFFIFISFDAVYVYAAELFPTVIRYGFLCICPHCCHKFESGQAILMHENWFSFSRWRWSCFLLPLDLFYLRSHVKQAQENRLNTFHSCLFSWSSDILDVLHESLRFMILNLS